MLHRTHDSERTPCSRVCQPTGWSSIALAVLACLVGCSGETPPNRVKEAFAQAANLEIGETSVAFRFPTAARAPVQLYQLPSLAPLKWDFNPATSPITQPVGYAEGEDLMYALTQAGQFVAIDVATGRTRILDTAVVHAALGPTGVPFLVRRDGSIVRVSRRSLARWSTTVQPLPERVWAAARNRLVALVVEDSTRLLLSLADGRPTVTHRIPDGPIAVSSWGDAAVVGSDSGLVLYATADSGGVVFERVRPAPGPVAISSAAHQVYTVDAEDRLLAYDRFELRRLRRVELPGPASDLRTDPLGRLLLVRAADRDSIWIVDLVAWERVTAIAGSWDTDLPLVAPDGTIVVRQGEDVVAVSGGSWTVTDRAQGGATDRWSTVAWNPRRPTIQMARDTLASVAPTGGAFYVQVSSTRNRAWADDFAQNLRRAGMDANVLPPRDADDLYRVVLGPYPTREAAEATSRQLGLPSWITTRDTTSGIP